MMRRLRRYASVSLFPMVLLCAGGASVSPPAWAAYLEM